MPNHELSWKEAYEMWAETQPEIVLADIAQRGIAEDLLTTLPWLAFDCGSPRVLLGWFGHADRSLLAKACALPHTMPYVAAILRLVQATTPESWHLAEPEPQP